MVGLRALAPLHVDAVLAFAEIYAGYLSDHVDWPGLNELVAGSGAEAARWFGECGLATESF